MISTIISLSVVSILLLLFLLMAARDLSMLVRRPIRGLGTGFSRIWAVARTTMLEAWAGRVWLLPILWFIAAVVLLLAVRPFDESERIPLYIRVLLTSQEIMLLLMLWVMACVSFPRERERKIVITNASKPLSRLEILLGKMVGFSLTSLLLLVVMGAISWALLLVADQRIRSNARAEFALAETDYKTKSSQLKEAVPPPMDKKRLAEEGSLFAANYLNVPPKNMSIAGLVEETPDKKLIRYIKGGSDEQVIYRFGSLDAADRAIGVPPNLPGRPYGNLAPVGQRPFFMFHFPVKFYSETPPARIQLNVTAVRAKQRLRPQQKSVILSQREGLFVAFWEPDQVEEIFSFPGERDNGEIEVIVTCPTPGVFLMVLDGVPRDKARDVREFNVAASSRLGPTDWELPLPEPQMRGFERRDKQQIEGPSIDEMRTLGTSDPPREFAIFRFPAKDLKNVPVENGHFKLSMVLDIDKEKNQERDTIAFVRAFNYNAPAEAFEQSLTVTEKRSTEVLIPEAMLGGSDVEKRGDLIILLNCDTPGHWLSMLHDSVRIQQPPSPFLINLLKSELVLFCEASLLVVICVACSVRLGWPVAMLTSITCYFLGWMRGFISEVQELGGMGALGFTNYGEQSTSYRVADVFLSSVWKLVGVIIALTPDFRRFDAQEFIIQLRNMPWLQLGLDLGWAFLYALPFIGLGYMMIRKQELG
jgi:hypothetical protein